MPWGRMTPSASVARARFPGDLGPLHGPDNLRIEYRIALGHCEYRGNQSMAWDDI
jgi:hypothetical protein